MQLIKVDPWKVYLHEKPIQKNLEFFLKNPGKILEFPIAVVIYDKYIIVIDGTHRVIASRIRKISKIPAIAFNFSEYNKFIKVKKWYGFTNKPLRAGNLELGGEYRVEIYQKRGWKPIAKISVRQYEMLLPFLKFSTKSTLNGMSYRIHIDGNITHREIIERAISGRLFSPKTTAHFVEIEGRLYHIEAIEKDKKLMNKLVSIIHIKGLYSRRPRKRY